MEEAFNKLLEQGKNDVDNLMQWIKDSKVIDKSKEQEEKVRNLFSDVADRNKVTVENFRTVVQHISTQIKKSVDDISKQLADNSPQVQDTMTDVFRNLEKAGKSDVDNLIKWMKDSKLIEATKDGEAKARKMFKDASDQTNVDLDNFKSVVTTLAQEQKKSFDELSKQLADEGPKLMKAVEAGMKAFTESLKEK